jgi:hypothetical protein
MATITKLPHTQRNLSPPKPLVLDSKTTSQLQSPEGRIINELLQEITSIKDYLESLPVNSEIEYNPVPPKRSERVIMRAKFKGRGKPQPYPLDEE